MPPQAAAASVSDLDVDDLDVDTKKDNNDNDNDNNNVVVAGPEHQIQKATCFSDERGNLKFVNLVVRRPMTMFFGILGVCLILTFLLGALVFKEGNPFSNPENQFDMDDVRSIQYDSLRLAAKQVQGRLDIAEQQTTTNTNNNNDTSSSGGGGNTALAYQSENGDVMYWVFEGENADEGVFGSTEGIAAMKEALDLFLLDVNYTDYCQIDNTKKTNGNGNDSSCMLPLTALNMYYASEWDSELITSLTDELASNSSKIPLFNMVAICVKEPSTCANVLQPLNCTTSTSTNNNNNLLMDCIDASDLLWVNETNTKLETITSKWDGQSLEIIGNITEYTEFASYLLQIPLYKFHIDLAYDKQFSTTNLISMYSRAIIPFGKPLASADDLRAAAGDDEDKYEAADRDALKTYIVDNFLKDMDELADESTHEELNSYYFMGALILDVLLEIVQTDGMLAIISLTFVFVWLRLNVSSWFLATVGIVEIFFSIPVGWFLFTVVFQIKYFAFLNSLSLFIVAAIGADDIFIFMDAYQQSARVKVWPDLETRMSWVYRRTGTAMAITSATTCTAFLCTLITPLVQIQSFGIFAALVILMDYVLVMTLFCTSVIIYHNKYESRGCCGGGCWKKNLEVTPTDQARIALEDAPEGEALKGDRISEFFKTKMAPFILNQRNRLVLFVVFAVWIGVAVWQTAQLEPTRETEQFLNEDHPLQKSFTILGNEFPTADEDLGLPVHYAWGLREVDRSGVALLLDPTNFGTPQYIPDMEWDASCQKGLLEVCEEFQSLPDYKELIKRKNALGTVSCVWEELLPFYVNASQNLGYQTSDGSYCEFVNGKTWKTQTQTYNNYTIPPEELDGVISEFVSSSLRSCIEPGTSVKGRYKNELGFDGTTLQYVSISVESSVLDPFSRKPESVARAEYDQFVTIQTKLTERNICHSSSSSSSSSGTSPEPVLMTDLNEIFIFMNNQSIYVQTAIQSSLLGVAIAFVVLLLATRKLHLAAFASLSIACVLVSVTGTMVLIGWTLGSIESILIGIIAGFSVDYVVHLAHAYETADDSSGEETTTTTASRITESFSTMGISVLNGMITSIAASIPLFFCQLQFFHKFGVFICLTIAFSWIFANFLFMSVLAQLKIPIQKKKKNENTNTKAAATTAVAVVEKETKKDMVSSERSSSHVYGSASAAGQQQQQQYANNDELLNDSGSNFSDQELEC